MRANLENTAFPHDLLAHAKKSGVSGGEFRQLHQGWDFIAAAGWRLKS
jgi:hypothetical protein